MTTENAPDTVETKEPKKDLLTSNVTAEIIKPLSTDWETFGKVLRDITDVSHRALNAAVLECALADRSQEKVVKEDRISLQTIAYRAVKAHMERERADAEKAAGKAKTNAKSENFQNKLSRMQALTLTGGNMSAMAQAAYTAYSTWKKTSWRGEKSLPSFRAGAPIFVRGDQWSIAKDGKGYALTIKLEGGREGVHFRVALGVRGGSAYSQFAKMVNQNLLLSGDVKLGDLKILRLERKKKWLVRICYSWKKPVRDEALDPNKIIVVHRGVRNFLTIGALDMHPISLPGDEIRRKKNAFENRRRETKQMTRAGFLGEGAHGHGKNRRYEVYGKMDDAEAKWVRTISQQAAAWIVAQAKRQGAGTVVVEDYSVRDLKASDKIDERLRPLIARWPFAILKDATTWATKKAAIACEEGSVSDGSNTCPKCGNCDENQKTPRYQTFKCFKCEFAAPLDFVAVWNMLRWKGKDITSTLALYEERLKQDVMVTAEEPKAEEAKVVVKKPRRKVTPKGSSPAV